MQDDTVLRARLTETNNKAPIMVRYGNKQALAQGSSSHSSSELILLVLSNTPVVPFPSPIACLHLHTLYDPSGHPMTIPNQRLFVYLFVYHHHKATPALSFHPPLMLHTPPHTHAFTPSCFLVARSIGATGGVLHTVLAILSP